MKTSVQNTVNCTTDDILKEEKNMKKQTVQTANINDIINEGAKDIATKARKIREALVERTAYVVAAKSCPIEPAEIRETTRNFLGQLSDEQLAGGADVVLRKELTGIESGFQTEKVVLAWDKNPKAGEEGKRPNVLWVHVLPVQRQEKPMADKAVSFFQKRVPDMPETVVRQIFEAAWDGEEITICAHPSAKPVVLKAQADKTGKYILQVPDPKGNFVPNKPIAYAVGNRVYVSIPGTQYGKRWTFRANPAPKQG